MIKVQSKLYRKDGRVWIASNRGIEVQFFDSFDSFKAQCKAFNQRVVKREDGYHIYFTNKTSKEIVKISDVEKRKSAKEQGLTRGNQKRKTPRTMKKALINNEYTGYTHYEIEQLKARIKRDIKKVRNRSQLLQSSVNIDKGYLNAQLKAELQQVNKCKMILKKLDDLKNHAKF